jgi:8-amino-7-oxononanoate synthase
MDSLEEYFSNQLHSRQSKGILRTLKISDAALKDFTSNDYLGLARSSELKDKIQQALANLKLRNGATGSRLLSGNSVLCQQLESQLATIFNADTCLVFNSGYAANLGVLSAIPTRHDTILYDELCHASIKDGVRLSLAKKLSFKHNDLNDLEQKIVKATGKVFIVAESIYSMDGDLCPLTEFVKLSEQRNCFLILDEAHSTGVLGEAGAGLAVSLGLQNKIAIRIYTFGKAIGIHGACVAGSKNLIEYLINFSRPFIYTTALPDHTIIGLSHAFNFIRHNPELQNILHAKIELFRNSLIKNITTSSTAIQSLILGSVEKTREKADNLIAKGFDVRPIFTPTVPQGSERLRICLHTFNSNEDITNLAAELNEQ